MVNTVYGFEAGYIVTTDERGNRTRHAIADVLRAADIPALTYAQVAAIRILANLIVVLIRTLIDRGTLDESFLEDDDFDLDAIVAVVENIGGSYHEPDILGT